MLQCKSANLSYVEHLETQHNFTIMKNRPAVHQQWDSSLQLTVNTFSTNLASTSEKFI